MAVGDLVLTGLMAVLLVGIIAVLTRIENWRSYTPLAGGGTATGEDAVVLNREKPTGLVRWLTTVDHKDIGLLYLLFGSVAFFWGGMDAMMIRTELFTPEVDVWNATTYNGLFTMHGLTMLFFFATPILFGFANYFLPLLIG